MLEVIYHLVHTVYLCLYRLMLIILKLTIYFFFKSFPRPIQHYLLKKSKDVFFHEKHSPYV